MRRAVPLVLAIAIVSSGCGRERGVADGVSPTPTASEDYDIGTREETFVDPARDAGATNGRSLRTVISYPERDGEVAPGRFPLVLYSHGLRGTPEDYDALIGGWVRDGFIVAAPAYPLTNRDATDVVPSDVVQQPADASFVLTSVIELGARDGDPLEGHVDGGRLAAAGHSLGGITTVGLFKTCCADRRLDAGVVLAGNAIGFPGAFAKTDASLVFIHGDDDRIISYRSGRLTFADAGKPKALVRLIEGDHITPYLRHTDPGFAIVAATTLDLFRWRLKGDEGALAALRNHADEKPVATLVDNL